MTDIRKVDIHTKLAELGTPIEELVLGDFDAIGDSTAKKARGRDNPLYKTAGCFFRPNYERGMLAACMIRKHKPLRILEIGFGRGYWATCAAKAMYELNIDGKITSVDVNFDQNHLQRMAQTFPAEWLNKIEMHRGRSIDVIPKLEGEWDLVYIDGDHTYQGVKADWELVKDRFKQFVIFDDYHLPEKKKDPNIDVARLVDELDYEKELVIMDRLVFNDDRGHEDRPYGQVILRHPEYTDPEDAYSYDW